MKPINIEGNTAITAGLDTPEAQLTNESTVYSGSQFGMIIDLRSWVAHTKPCYLVLSHSPVRLG